MSKSTMLPRALPVVLAVCLALGMFNCVAGQTLIDSTTHESSAGSQAAQDAATPPGDAGDATRDASAVEAVDMAANDTSRASNGSPASSHSNDKAPEAVQVVAEDDEKTPSSTSQNLTDPASKPPVAEGVRADDSIDSGFGSSDYPGIGYLPPSSTDTLDGTSLDTGTCRRYSLGSLSEDKGVEQPLEQRVCLDRASSFAMKEGGLVDAVFLGDDNIKRWVSDAPDTWKWMSSNVMKGSPANLGCDGMDSTGGLAAAWRLVEQTPLSPKAWVLSLGSNDCVDGGSYEAVASKLQDIIQVLRFYNCYSQVVVNAILPSTLGSDGHDWESSPHRTCIQNTNSAMKRFAAKNSHMGVSFVDCGSSFLSVRGNTIDRTKMPDGHHLSHTGYTTLAACLGKHLLPYSALERSKYPQSFDFSTQPKPSPASKPNKYDWSFSDWSSCTGACGSGMQTRTAFCADAASGQEVEESRCGERGSLTLLRQCSRPPCVFFSFVAGPWSECSKTCGTGTSKRNVTCMGSDGTHAADSACKGGASLAATKPSEETECNSQPCNSACGPGGGCSGNGMCSEKRDRCICRPGFKGTWCHVSADCSSGAASTSGCCPSGIVAADGSCAPTGAAIDLNGKVCASGSLDVCGVCDGNGASVDVFGQCCDGQLDAAGVCCRGNHKIDECGACSGSSSTCAVVAQVTVEATGYNDLDVLMKMDFKEGVASGLKHHGVAPEQVSVASVTMTPGDNVAEVSVRITPAVEPGPAGPLTVGTFEDAFESEEDLRAAMILSVVGARRSGVCGNNICEIGEQSVGDVAGSCLDDCPLSFNVCQADGDGTACSGHGRCIPANGACDCHPGYAGVACQLCQGGFEKTTSGHCLPYVGVSTSRDALMNAASSRGGDPGSFASLMPALLLVIVCVLAVALVGFGTYHAVFVRQARDRMPEGSNKHQDASETGAKGSGTVNSRSSPVSSASSSPLRATTEKECGNSPVRAGVRA